MAVTTSRARRVVTLGSDVARRIVGWLGCRRRSLREWMLRRWSGGLAVMAAVTARPERGSMTAEYAIVTLAAVAFAGLLLAIFRGGEIREILLDLIRGALGR